MRSSPAKAATSMKSVERGRWKLVSSRSTARKRKPGTMKMSVSPRPRLDRAVMIARHRFEQAQRGRADRDDPAARRARRLDGARRLLRHLAPFGMHGVGVGVVDAHRLEGPGADMQRDARRGDAGGGERGHQPGREMQARGGRGHRAVVAGRTASGSRRGPAHRPRRRVCRAAAARRRPARGPPGKPDPPCRRRARPSRPRSWPRPWRSVRRRRRARRLAAAAWSAARRTASARRPDRGSAAPRPRRPGGRPRRRARPSIAPGSPWCR